MAKQATKAVKPTERALFVRDCVQSIFSAAATHEEARAGLAGSIIAAFISGVTFQELEGVQITGFDGKPMTRSTEGGEIKPYTLKDVSAYRSYKSKIKAAKRLAGIQDD